VSARLARLVVRVPIDLGATLDGIAGRLFEETRIEYSHASIVRGLIRMGLTTVTVAGDDGLAPLFAGVRVPRGRKKGERRPRVADLDLEFEDEHHEGHERREVVARPRRP
jgi:hypothetical protein